MPRFPAPGARPVHPPEQPGPPEDHRHRRRDRLRQRSEPGRRIRGPERALWLLEGQCPAPAGGGHLEPDRLLPDHVGPPEPPLRLPPVPAPAAAAAGDHRRYCDPLCRHAQRRRHHRGGPVPANDL